MAHAKNVCIRLAGNGIVVNVDADNYCGRGFDRWCLANVRKGVMAVASVDSGVAGRIAATKGDFIALCGYNENFVAWGNEDCDLKRRFKSAGGVLIPIPDQFSKAIPHDDYTRMQNYSIKDKLASSQMNLITEQQGWHPTEWGHLEDLHHAYRGL